MSDELIYKTHAQAPPAAADELSPMLTDVLGAVVAEERQRAREEREQELAPLRAALDALKRQVEDLKVEFRVERGVRERLQRADVIDLPKRA